MSLKEKWNETYDKNSIRAPWISEEHKKYVDSWLQKHFCEDVVWKRILDYWCGDCRLFLDIIFWSVSSLETNFIILFYYNDEYKK